MRIHFYFIFFFYCAFGMEKAPFELNPKEVDEVRRLLRFDRKMGDEVQVMKSWLIQQEVEEKIPKDICEFCGDCCCNTACGCSLGAGCGVCFSLGLSTLLNGLINLRICQQTDAKYDTSCMQDTTIIKYGFPVILTASMLFGCGANLYADMKKSERLQLKNKLLKEKME